MGSAKCGQVDVFGGVSHGGTVHCSPRTPTGPIIHPPLNQTPLAMLVRQRGRHRSVPVVGTTYGLAGGSRLDRGIRPSRRVPVDTSQPSQRLHRLWIRTRVATARRWPTWRVGSPPKLGVPVDTHRSRQIAEGQPTHRTREDEQTLAERNHHSNSCC